jgi:metal-responsive CopG/Arc/MetJ family transcriptional regulator
MSPVGRPEIGQPINIRLGDELLAAIDAKARRLGESRAEVIRMLLADALANEMSTD